MSSAAVGCSVLQVAVGSVRLIYRHVAESNVSLGIFSLGNLSIAASGVVKSPPPTVVSLVFPFRSVSILLNIFWCICMYDCCILLIDPFIII